MVMPPSEKRRMISSVLPARGLPSRNERSSGSVACTETLMGLMCRWMMRCTSRSDRFGRVI